MHLRKRERKRAHKRVIDGGGTRELFPIAIGIKFIGNTSVEVSKHDARYAVCSGREDVGIL